MGRTPTDLAQALQTVAERPTPALIWRDGAERVELSGRVLVNWVEKAAGLLVDELDVGASDVLTISPVPHWRLAVLTFAALRAGARVDFTRHPEPDSVVHAYPESHPDDDAAAQTLLVVAEPALAFECSGPLPKGAVDFCDEVRAQPDMYGGLENPEPDSVALPSGVTHAEVLPRALELAGTDGGTVYLPLTEGWGENAALRTLGIITAGGAVVLTARPEDATAAVLDQERATRG